MLEKAIQKEYPETIECEVNQKMDLPSVIFDSLNIVEMADHLNVPISEKDRQLNTKPFFIYPKDGLYGLL